MKTVFINPFEKYSTNHLLLVGLLSMGIGSAAGFYFNARFDGVIDLHFVAEVRPYDALLDLVISIGITALALFALGKYNNPKTRFIDLLNASLVAKIPLYVFTVFNYGGYLFKTTEKLMKSVQENAMNVPDPAVMAPILLFGLISIAGLVLSIVLLYNGFKVAANAKGSKMVFGFVIALLAAEILSKIAISLLP
jgi:hypothetical protein